MTGTLAQLVALTAYGNDYLKNETIPTDFDSANTTFQFCAKVDFRKIKNSFFSSTPKERVIANCPMEWFQYLKNDRCKYLRLYFENSKDQGSAKDYQFAGFVGGGGTWLIETGYDKYSNYWISRWEATDPNAINKKIWTVNYGMVIAKQPSKNLQFDLQEIKNKLLQTLTEIAEFAFEQNMQGWSEQFNKAKAILDSSTPNESYYHKDLIPPDNYSLTARQILFASGSAWVFGGMGSWNDLGFDNKEANDIYERLSGQLYSNINEAIVAATNTY